MCTRGVGIAAGSNRNSGSDSDSDGDGDGDGDDDDDDDDVNPPATVRHSKTRCIHVLLRVGPSRCTLKVAKLLCFLPCLHATVDDVCSCLFQTSSRVAAVSVAEACLEKLGLAERLVNGLADEYQRWTATVKDRLDRVQAYGSKPACSLKIVGFQASSLFM